MNCSLIQGNMCLLWTIDMNSRKVFFFFFFFFLKDCFKGYMPNVSYSCINVPYSEEHMWGCELSFKNSRQFFCLFSGKNVNNGFFFFFSFFANVDLSRISRFTGWQGAQKFQRGHNMAALYRCLYKVPVYLDAFDWEGVSKSDRLPSPTPRYAPRIRANC